MNPKVQRKLGAMGKLEHTVKHHPYNRRVTEALSEKNSKKKLKLIDA